MGRVKQDPVRRAFPVLRLGAAGLAPQPRVQDGGSSMSSQVILCDLVGTVYSSEGVIAGAVEAIADLRRNGHDFRFLTNTDSKSTVNLLTELAQKGLDVEAEELFTPVTAAMALIGSQPGARILAVTTREVSEQLAIGLEVVDDPAASVTHVVVGDIRSRLDYELLNSAYRALVDGAEMVALQREPYFLSSGRRQLDTGAVVVALEFASGKKATVVGKPNPLFLSFALRSLDTKVAKDTVWMVGDDRMTDVAAGRAAEVHTVLVRTGKFRNQVDIADAPEPEYVIDSLVNLPALIGQRDR